MPSSPHLHFLKVEEHLLIVLLACLASLALVPGAEGARRLAGVPRGARTTRRARAGALRETRRLDKRGGGNGRDGEMLSSTDSCI